MLASTRPLLHIFTLYHRCCSLPTCTRADPVGVVRRDMLRLQGLCNRIAVPAGFSSSVVHGHADADYYHYLCDGIDDRVSCLFFERGKELRTRSRLEQGWGCGYRTAQSLCSWAARSRHESSAQAVDVPSLRKIQETLVEIGDKAPSFADSREWIGCVETSLVLDQLYGVSVVSRSNRRHVCRRFLLLTNKR